MYAYVNAQSALDDFIVVEVNIWATKYFELHN